MPLPPNSPLPPPFTIIDESDEWIVVNKPALLEVHPSKPDGRRTLWHGLRELLSYELINGGQVSIINRLDRETSGLTLIAKTHRAARSFHLKMAARRFEKEYLAIVWGWPSDDRFTVDAAILRKGTKEPSLIHLKQMVHPDGASARTTFDVQLRFQRQTPNGTRFSLVRCAPETGRMHQIRVHLSHAGFPIVGDKLYGPDEGCYLEFIKTGWTQTLAERLLLPRQALHSCGLRVRGESLGWTAPLATDLAAFCDAPGSVSSERTGTEFARDGASGNSINASL